MAKNSNYKGKNTQAAKPDEKKQKLGYIAMMVAALLVVAACLALIIWPKGDTYADIVIKDYGTVTVKLEPDVAPITVANFVKLAKSGFYDGLTFHRIMEGFMMQGGAPKDGKTQILLRENSLPMATRKIICPIMRVPSPWPGRMPITAPAVSSLSSMRTATS